MPHISDGFISVSGPNAYERYCEIRQAERKRNMKHRPINMIITVALMLGLLVFCTNAFPTEFSWLEMVDVYGSGQVHTYIIDGQIDQQATKEALLSIDGINTIQVEYMDALDQTWVEIGCVVLNWDEIDPAVSAIMGFNRVKTY
jgi:hypothetical protein